MGNFYVQPTPRTATLTVAASNSKDARFADYRCDGTSDQVEIQSAIDAATALPEGGKVVLLDGFFSVSDHIILKSNVVLEGQGINVTTIKVANASTITNQSVIDDNSVNILNAYCGKMTIDCNKVNQTTSSQGVSLYHATNSANITIEKILAKNAKVVANFGGNGFDLELIQNLTVKDCISTGNDVGGFYFYNSISDSVFNVEDCIAYSNGLDGFNFDGLPGMQTIIKGCLAYNNVNGSGFTDFADGNTNTYIGCSAIANGTTSPSNGFSITVPSQLYGCFATGNGLSGIDISGPDCIVSGCYLSSNLTQEIKISAARAIISGNTIYTNINPSSGFLINIASTGEFNISDNTITVDTGNTSAVVAIVDASGIGSGKISGNLINFQTTGLAHVGFKDSGASSQSIISDNLITIKDKTLGSIGISVASGSSYYTITGNNTAGGEYGMKLNSMGDSTIVGNICQNNTNGCDISGIAWCAFSDNHFDSTSGGAGIGIVATSGPDWCNISGNVITSYGHEGMSLNGIQDCTISNNIIRNVGKTTNNTYAALLLTDNGSTFSTHNTLSGNVISSAVTNVHKYGIRENATSDNSNIVTSNQVLNAATTAISLQGAQSIQANNITA